VVSPCFLLSLTLYECPDPPLCFFGGGGWVLSSPGREGWSLSVPLGGPDDGLFSLTAGAVASVSPVRVDV